LQVITCASTSFSEQIWHANELTFVGIKALYILLFLGLGRILEGLVFLKNFGTNLKRKISLIGPPLEIWIGSLIGFRKLARLKPNFFKNIGVQLPKKKKTLLLKEKLGF